MITNELYRSRIGTFQQWGGRSPRSAKLNKPAKAMNNKLRQKIVIIMLTLLCQFYDQEPAKKLTRSVKSSQSAGNWRSSQRKDINTESDSSWREDMKWQTDSRWRTDVRLRSRWREYVNSKWRTEVKQRSRWRTDIRKVLDSGQREDRELKQIYVWKLCIEQVSVTLRVLSMNKNEKELLSSRKKLTKKRPKKGTKIFVKEGKKKITFNENKRLEKSPITSSKEGKKKTTFRNKNRFKKGPHSKKNEGKKKITFINKKRLENSPKKSFKEGKKKITLGNKKISEKGTKQKKREGKKKITFLNKKKIIKTRK